MRRKVKFYLQEGDHHRDDDLRIISKFLFFPCLLSGEWRWWERVNIIQEYSATANKITEESHWFSEKWYDYPMR